MGRTIVHQDTQVRPSNDFDDSLPSGPGLELNSTSLQYDLNAIRSQIRRITGEPSWRDAPSTQLTLRKLLYFIDDGPAEGHLGGYREIVGSPWPSSVAWYVDGTKAKKIVEKLILRNGDMAPVEITWILYNEDGFTPLITAVDVIVNTGDPAVFEVSRTRTIT